MTNIQEKKDLIKLLDNDFKVEFNQSCYGLFHEVSPLSKVENFYVFIGVMPDKKEYVILLNIPDKDNIGFDMRNYAADIIKASDTQNIDVIEIDWHLTGKNILTFENTFNMENILDKVSDIITSISGDKTHNPRSKYLEFDGITINTQKSKSDIFPQKQTNISSLSHIIFNNRNDKSINEKSPNNTRFLTILLVLVIMLAIIYIS